MPPKRPSPCLQARLAVLTSTLGAAAGLLRIGYPPIAATLIALGGAAGAVEISCRLTNPHPAPAARITVVVVILIFIVRLLGLGYPPAPTLAGVLLATFIVTEIARRLTGVPYRLPRLTY